MTEDKRLICPQCGHDNPYDFLICGQCGADLLIDTPDSEAPELDKLEPDTTSPQISDIEKEKKSQEAEKEDKSDLKLIQEQIRKSASSGYSSWLATSFDFQLNLGSIAIIAWIIFFLVVGGKFFINKLDDIPLKPNKNTIQNQLSNAAASNSSNSVAEVKKNELPANAIKVIVREVKSGEVIQVYDPAKETVADIRLIGVVAPASYPNGTSEKGAIQAYQYLVDRIKGREVGLVYGITKSEIGVPWKPRSFAYVYFEGDMINLELITKGLVIFGDPIPENVKIAEEFKQAQSVAKREKIGLWAEL